MKYSVIRNLITFIFLLNNLTTYSATLNDDTWYVWFNGGLPNQNGSYPVKIVGYNGEKTGLLDIPLYILGSYYPKTIGYAVFKDYKFTEISIASCVKEIEDKAFYGCRKVTQIRCDATVPPKCGYDVFYGIDKSSCKLIVPEGSISAYKEADGWKDFFVASGNKSEMNDIVNDINVSVENGDILVKGAECGSVVVEIYTVSGMLVYRGCNTSIPVASGMYIVKVDGKTYKVAV